MTTPNKIGSWTFIRELQTKNKKRILIECNCGKQRKVDKWDYLHIPHSNLGDKCRKCSELLYWKDKDEMKLYNLIYMDYIQQAKRRGYEFSLTLLEAYELFISPCHFCGSLPSNIKTHGKNKTISYKYQGIDRKNPNLGYINSNVLPCCKHCNYAKREMSYDEFIKWVNNVYNYVVQRPERNLVGSSEPK